MNYLSKSDFKVAQTCPTMLFYKKQRYPSDSAEDDYLAMLADGGYMVEKIAKLLYPDGHEIAFGKSHSLAAQDTLQALKGDSATLFEATFISNGKLARVDILDKRGNELRLIEVKSKSYSSDDDAQAKAAGYPNLFRTKRGNGIVSGWQEYLEDVTFQVMVLQEVFPKAVIKPFLMMPDKSKTTHIDLIHSLFRLKRVQQPGRDFDRVVVDFIGDVNKLRKDHFLTLVPVGREVQLLMPEVQKAAATYLPTLNPKLTKIQTPITVACRGCDYHASATDPRDGFHECWGKLGDVQPHLLDLYHVSSIGGRGGPVANALIQEGKVSLLDVPKGLLVTAKGTAGVRNERQAIQIDYTRKNAEWMSPEFPKILRSFKYPLHFIDFETTAIAVPYHAGMRPYEQVAFQWSCHRLDSPGGQLTHTEWINAEDVFPNFKFAESLMECVGDGGTVFMWATHENTILANILRQTADRKYRNPKLAKWLKTMVRTGTNPGRLVDLNQLTVRHYFHPLMKGRTSIKKVSDALWQTNPSLRKAFPEYLKEQDGGLLSPYAALPPLEIDGIPVAVAEGTGAIKAYEAMVYGLEKDDPKTKETWKRLLLQYCKLDTLSMVMVWRHWNQLITRKPA